MVVTKAGRLREWSQGEHHLGDDDAQWSELVDGLIAIQFVYRRKQFSILSYRDMLYR